MRNRFVYIFMKDMALTWQALLAVVILAVSLLTLGMGKQQAVLFRDLKAKKDLVAQIPQMEAQLQKIRDNQGLVLNGIIFNESMPLVIINNTVLKVGAEVAGKVVQAISPEGVVLADKAVPEKTIELLLDEE